MGADWEGRLEALYWACVDFMIHGANLLGVTYRDANSLIFFVIWPLVTATLAGAALWQGIGLLRLSRRRG